MCAPHRLKMEQTSISRSGSQSTNSTLIGTDNSIVSPVMNASALADNCSMQSPIIQTLDNRQWIDLDILSPKLLKEVRRQYGSSLKEESTGAIAKGKLMYVCGMAMCRGIRYSNTIARKINVEALGSQHVYLRWQG